MKLAMIEVNRRLREENVNAKLILQIHDELLIECKIEEKDIVRQILKESMENAFKLDVPLEIRHYFIHLSFSLSVYLPSSHHHGNCASLE